MEMVKVTLRWAGRPGCLADVVRQYALPKGALDEDYGIQEADEQLGQFAVRVRAELAPALEGLISSPGTCRSSAESSSKDGRGEARGDVRDAVRSSLPS